MSKPELHLFCGKMAAGKSTLALELSQRLNAVLIIEDHWLKNLYPEEIIDIPGYIKFSTRLNNIITGHVVNILATGVSVVLDFPANTIHQRNLLKEIIQETNAKHTLHYLNASNELCKKQLIERNKSLQEGAAFTTEEEFDEITKYFQEPAETEGFNIKEYS